MSNINNILANKTERQLKAISMNLARMVPYFNVKAQKEVIRPAAELILNTMKSNTPVADKVVKRYKKDRFGRRAKRGEGVVAAVYNPGHLRDSMKIMEFGKSSSLFIGPSAKGSDEAYFAHMVEYGTKNQKGSAPVRRTFDSKKNEAKRMLIKGFRSKLDEYKRSLK